MDLDEVHPWRLEFGHTSKNAAIEGATFELRKPTLDSVQPGHAGWREMAVDIRPGLQPVKDLLRGLSPAPIVPGCLYRSKWSTEEVARFRFYGGSLLTKQAVRLICRTGDEFEAARLQALKAVR